VANDDVQLLTRRNVSPNLALTSSIDLMKILPLNARESNALRERFCKLSNNAKASYLVSMNLLKFAIKHSLRRLAKFAGH
jgi:hypothetical protein